MALLGGATLVSFLSGHAFPGEFAALFRLQYAIGLVVVAAVAAAIRRRAVAAAAAVFLALNLGPLASAWFAGARPDPAGGGLRLLVANVWYPGEHYARVAGLIREERPDIVALVELTHDWEAGLAGVLEPYRHRVVQAQPGAFGVGIFSRVPLTDSRIIGLGGREWPPVAVATVTAAGQCVRLFVVHPPPPIGRGSSVRNRDVLRALGAAAAREGGSALVCGDLNATPWSGPYLDLLERGGLERADAWRPTQWTFPVGNPLLRAPIDHCVAGRRLAVSVRVDPDVGSDHRPQLVEVGPAS